MTRYKLAEKIDLDTLYDIELCRCGAEYFDKLGITRTNFKKVLETHPSIGYEADGKPIGGMVFDGNQPHISVDPKHHGRWCVLWKSSLKWLFSIQDPVRAMVETKNTECLDFMDSNGWERVDANENFITFEVTSKNHLLFRSRQRRKNASESLS